MRIPSAVVVMVIMLAAMPCPAQSRPATTTAASQPAKDNAPPAPPPPPTEVLVTRPAIQALADVELKDFCKDDTIDFRAGDPSGTLFMACDGYQGGAIVEGRRSGYGVGVSVFDTSPRARQAIEYRRHNVASLIEPGQATPDHPQPWWVSRKPDSMMFILFDNMVVEVFAKWGDKLDLAVGWQVAQRVADDLREISAQPPGAVVKTTLKDGLRFTLVCEKAALLEKEALKFKVSLKNTTQNAIQLQGWTWTFKDSRRSDVWQLSPTYSPIPFEKTIKPGEDRNAPIRVELLTGQQTFNWAGADGAQHAGDGSTLPPGRWRVSVEVQFKPDDAKDATSALAARPIEIEIWPKASPPTSKPANSIFKNPPSTNPPKNPTNRPRRGGGNSGGG